MMRKSKDYSVQCAAEVEKRDGVHNLAGGNNRGIGKFRYERCERRTRHGEFCYQHRGRKVERYGVTNAVAEGVWLKPTIRNGRFFVKLSSKSQTRECAIHRLILETYIGPCPVGMECRHLDGNPQNNNLDNLCWGTRLQNQQDRIKHGTTNCGERNGRSKITEKKVRRIRQMLKIGILSQKRIAQFYQITQMTVSNIKQKRIWKNI